MVNGLLAAAADLALSPKPKDKTPADGGVANVSAVDLTNSASVGARLSSELLQSCTALAASPDPLAAASLPFDAIRAAVAMLMGQRADLRSAGRVLLSCQALGVSRKSEVVGPEVWMKVCAVPEADWFGSENVHAPLWSAVLLPIAAPSNPMLTVLSALANPKTTGLSCWSTMSFPRESAKIEPVGAGGSALHGQ